MRRYDLTAKIYDMRYADEQEAKYKAALHAIVISGAVLDIGCGTGLLFNHVARQAENVVGVDVSKQLLLMARERAEAFRNVHLIQADADHLPFEKGCFNVVFAFTVLQNMPKSMETVKEISRTAMQGAPVVVTGLKKTFSLETFRELFQHAGLPAVSIEDADSLRCYVAVSRKGSK
jgi:ubiquinone/menaquinone biosynthesis C-methylase UbiE